MTKATLPHPGVPRGANPCHWLVRATALAFCCASLLGGCDRSCSRLADKLCEQASTSGDKNAEESCEAWKARSKRVSKETCQAALKHMELQR